MRSCVCGFDISIICALILPPPKSCIPPLGEGTQLFGGIKMRNLRCYRLANQLYRETCSISLPRHLKSQWLRACSSIVLSLAEGTGKSSQRDQKRFFDIALGSIRECQAIAELEPARFSPQQLDKLDHLAASTFKLIRRAVA